VSSIVQTADFADYGLSLSELFVVQFMSMDDDVCVQLMIGRHWSGTFSKCRGPSRTQFWHTRLLERSTRYSGRRLSPTGLPSATITAWKFSVCSCESHSC